jgi:hypothetical protein
MLNDSKLVIAASLGSLPFRRPKRGGIGLFSTLEIVRAYAKTNAMTALTNFSRNAFPPPPGERGLFV